MVVGVAISTFIAWLSWHLYERHFLKLKRYFRYHPGRAASGTTTDPEPLPSAAAR